MKMSDSAADPSSDRFLQLLQVSKRFDQKEAVCDVDLTIEQNEFFTLLGPSGCGKTTLLRIIGGLEQATSGTVVFCGRDLKGAPPERRPFNMVFQSYALFPHMSVAGNVGYGLQTAGLDRREIGRRVTGILELVNMRGDRDRSVLELSGGQQQRVALARALINEPDVLLLDEPLGALDLKMRKRLQGELRAIQSRLDTTFIYVTHDQEEALTMSHRIGVMNEGRLMQVGSPRDVYERPVCKFVAEFVGETNLIPCKVASVPSSTVVKVRVADGDDLELSNVEGVQLRPGDDVVAMVRPEHLELTEPGGLAGVVTESVFLGSHSRHEVSLDQGCAVRLLASGDINVSPGQRVAVRIADGKGIVVDDDGRVPSAQGSTSASLTAPAQPALELAAE